MKRKPTKAKDNTDYTVPVTPLPLEEADCFGQMYDALSDDCSICSSRVLCMIALQDQNKRKASEIAESYLDEVDLPTDAEVIARIKEMSGNWNSGELVSWIKERGRTTDDTLVIEMVKRLKTRYPQFSIKNSIVQWIG
jgi:hypothetical protein